MCLPSETKAAMLRVASLDESMLKEEFTVRARWERARGGSSVCTWCGHAGGWDVHRELLGHASSVPIVDVSFSHVPLSPSGLAPTCPSPRCMQVNYSGHDFARSILTCLGALAPAAIDDLGDDLAGSFSQALGAKAPAPSSLRAMPSAAADDAGPSLPIDDDGALPAFTVAVRCPDSKLVKAA